MSNINSEFYIIKSSNKLLNSDFATNYPKTCDGLRVHWQPDAGDLFETFSKNTEYVITLNDTVNIDLIRFYLVPESNYTKFGSPSPYGSSGYYEISTFNIYYSSDGTNWNIIDNNQASSASKYFSGYITSSRLLYYNGNFVFQGWASKTGFYALKLNQTIQPKYLKFSISIDSSDISIFKITEIEAFELLKFSMKEFRYNTERSIIDNGVNDFTIDCIADDLDFNIYNNIATRNEIFGKVNIDGTDYLYGNLIVDLTEIDTVSRELTMTLLPYTMINYNRIIDYNTPIIAKRSDYYPYDIIDLLMLMANKPSYFISGTGSLSPVIFIPQHNENIITNLTNFLEANRDFVSFRDYKDNWGFASRGYDTQSTYTKTSPQYIELPSGMSESSNPVIPFSQDFLDIGFWKEFFSQRIYVDYTKVNLTKTEAKLVEHRKVIHHVLWKTVKKWTETVYETVPADKGNNLTSYKDLTLLEYSPVKNAKDYHNNDITIMDAQEITASAMSIPLPTNPNGAMAVIFTFQIPCLSTSVDSFTRIDKIDFTYSDVRGEANFSLQFGQEFIEVSFGGTVINQKYYPDVFYYTTNTYFIVKIISQYNSTYVYPDVSIVAYNDLGQEIEKYYRNYYPNTQDNIRFSQMFNTNITGYTQAFATIKVWAKTGLGGNYYNSFKIQGLNLSGIARKYLVSSFPAYNALNIDIKDWQGFQLTNQQLNNNAEGTTIYKTGKNYNFLSPKEYTLNKIDYPVNTSNVYFAYILKNIYPYTTGGKLWEIASINETILFNISTPSNYIEKYCKNLNYSKTTNQYDREYIVSLLKIYQKDINKSIKDYSKDILLQITNDIIIDTIEGNLIDYNFISTSFQDTTNNIVYYLIADGQEHIINDSKNYFKYLIYADNYKIYYYIQNLKNTTPLSLVGKLNIDYSEIAIDDIEIINNYNTLQKQYGVIEYEANSMQTFTASQIYFIKNFFDWYNQSPVFTMKDIVIDGDMGLNLNSGFIKVIDNYLGKKIWIYPNRIEHYITEDLLFETSIQGKIIGEEAV